MSEPKTKSQVRYVCPKCEHVFLPSLKEKQSRAGKAARRKGANFEHNIAKKLLKWWPGDYEFKRTPMSGGSKLKVGWDLAADICTNAPDFKYSIECKNVPSSFTGLHNFFSDKSQIWSWLDQSKVECPKHRKPLLIFNRFDMPTFCATTYIEITIILLQCNINFFTFKNKNGHVLVWQFSDMLKSNPDAWK